jgi:hypothetical protein
LGIEGKDESSVGRAVKYLYGFYGSRKEVKRRIRKNTTVKI